MPTAVVIDDSAIMRRSLRDLLEQTGFTVVAEGENGNQAIELYERFRPSLITLDIVMPLKDGVTAATELLQTHPAAVVIMCTSLTSRDKILACQAAGVSHYLLKPFQPAKVVNVARRILQRTVQRAMETATAEVRSAP